MLLESFAARLGITLRDDRSTMSWVGQKEVDIYPPALPNGRQSTKRLLDSSDSSALPLRVNIVLVKPSEYSRRLIIISLTYEPYHTLELLMNISGKSAALAYRAHVRPSRASRVIILHDSLSHKPLSLHPRLGGSSNGHNGVASVISTLQGPNFHRVRIGIGRPETNGRYDGYVLEKLDLEERKWWGECGEGVEKAWAVIENIVGKELEEIK